MPAEFSSHFSASRRSVPSGERHAALALHGMAATDRDWMLQHVGTERRAVLERLLAELRELGVPQPLSLVEKPEARAPEAPAREVLKRLSGEQLHVLLRDEPDGLVADVLEALGPFRDRAELLRLLQGSGRTVDPALPVGMLSTRRADAIAEALVRRAAAMPVMKPSRTIPLGGGPVRWFQRLQSWRGSSTR